MKYLKYMFLVVSILSIINIRCTDPNLKKQATDYYKNKKVIDIDPDEVMIDFSAEKTVSEIDFINLQYLDNLTNFSICDCLIKDEYIKYLKPHKNLRVIALEGTDITDKAVQMICQNHPNLKRLYLSRTPITSNALKYIGNLKKLEVLEVRNTNIDDEGVKYISQLKDLKLLSLARTKLTNKSVPYLMVFNNIEEIAIVRCGISHGAYQQLYEYYQKFNSYTQVIHETEPDRVH